MLLSLRAPRAGLVDPETCPVCRLLHDLVGDVIRSGDPSSARPVVLAMHTHMIYGHPQDPRTIRPRESAK